MSAKLSEADLCAGFIDHAAKHGWTCYPEFAGFDFLLVRNGIQVGFQAKLRFTLKLLQQIIPSQWLQSGPQYRAVLVPETDHDLEAVCDFLGLAYFHGPTLSGGYRNGDRIKAADFGHHLGEHLPQWGDGLDLPEYVPDVRAGASAPLQLTKWKIAALKMSAILEIRGHATRDDFKALKIDHRRWIPSGWVRLEDGRYVANRLPFAAQHPTVYEQIKADIREYLKQPAAPKKKRGPA